MNQIENLQKIANYLYFVLLEDIEKRNSNACHSCKSYKSQKLQDYQDKAYKTTDHVYKQ